MLSMASQRFHTSECVEQVRCIHSADYCFRRSVRATHFPFVNGNLSRIVRPRCLLNSHANKCVEQVRCIHKTAYQDSKPLTTIYQDRQSYKPQTLSRPGLAITAVMLIKDYTNSRLFMVREDTSRKFLSPKKTLTEMRV